MEVSYLYFIQSGDISIIVSCGIILNDIVIFKVGNKKSTQRHTLKMV